MNDGEFLATEASRARRKRLVERCILAVGGAVQCIVALPWLFGHSPWWSGHSASTAHLTRDGALGIAFGTLALLVAGRVSRAWFAMPVALMLTVVQAVFVVVDTRPQAAETTGAPFGFELVHLLGVVLTVGIVAMTRRPRSAHRGLRLFDE